MLKEITNFPGYLVAPDGAVYSDKRKDRKQLSPRNLNGYHTVVLMKDGKQYVKYIHKLVATEFLHNDDPENKTQIIHKDGDKTNNNVSNLEWTKKGEGARRYFETHDTRRNKFKDTEDIPGTVLNGTSAYRVEPKTVQIPLSDTELTAKINGLSKKIANVKSRYTRKLMKLDMDYQKQSQQLKIHYKLDPAKAKKEIKELTIQHQANKTRLQGNMRKHIQKLEAEKTQAFRTRKELNKYFYYNGEYHKITDTGKNLVIRVKDEEGNWTMKSVARIIMEEYLKKPQPSPKHRIGFKDFDYRNIAPINMVWETSKEKAERYQEMFPFKTVLRDKKVKNANKSEQPEKFHDKIVKLLASGNNYRQVARKLSIPYYTLYRYCKAKGL